MRQVLFVALVLLVVSGGCGPDDLYYSGDQSGYPDFSSADLVAAKDLGGTQNEMRLYKSGARIKAKVLRAVDGAQAFVGWYDTEFDVNCQFLPAEDGKTRCIPVASANSLLLKDQGSRFSDAECTLPLYHSTGGPTDCTKESEWLIVFANKDACGIWIPIIYNKPHKYTGQKIYEKWADGSCVDMNKSPEGFIDSLGEKIEPDAFVEALPAIVD